MHTHLAQAKTLIRGQTSGQLITQGENGWLDLGDYQHVVVWLYVFAVTTGGTGSVSIAYQTAVRPEDGLFVTMTGPLTSAFITPVAGAVTVTPLMKDVLNVPLARWFRWQLSAGGTTPPWDIEFELLISASGARRSKRQGAQTRA